jgi:hypothetical protein
MAVSWECSKCDKTNDVASMFGRELSEQISADNTPVPAIVSKCIGAVEVVGEWLFFQAMVQY